ncbi:FAD-dependent oxidoreductase [Neptuniibacter sp. 1_MG-2023]|uniref:FAD-dependent oxidoreductase n=1 Tax=Neptuniibacter sp. 1_MG-2023 TaxID=3062662 RepID=UPI0026E44494|nr:FAD-dependent oxidoreductase [Neptuniibacter sp. 1_MG-2023]MDO6594249.1 FAD-dependent oxidoreductase [Neptuniibacter sp. 1_MG-2023]
MNTLKLDLIIIGGGIAGLWTLNRAVSAGFNAILLEKSTLGGGQSIRSQGIIHGGTKYALSGVLTQASNTIKEMPQRWRDCLDGQGEINLNGVNILSDAHYMWSKGSLGSRMTTFFATKAFRGRVEEVSANERPQVFKNKQFKGSLYRLNELVLDIPSVINTLRQPVENRIYQADITNAQIDSDGKTIKGITFPTQSLRLEAKNLVLTSGEGFEALAKTLDIRQPEMQRRPLHMVMVKHQYDLPTYAHCIGTGSKPVATITTHPCKDGKHIWYLGGNVAETGMDRTEQEQIAFAKEELATLLPWVDLSKAEWAAFHINRAEPKQSALVRPDSAYAEKVGNCIVAWPTKLALSPDLADQVLSLCDQPSQAVESNSLQPLQILPKPETAEPVWETLFC